jgi:serine/threonine protein kinase
MYNYTCLFLIIPFPFLLLYYEKAIKRKLSEQEGRRLFQQLIDGISYCHDKGVYHRPQGTRNDDGFLISEM